MSAALMELLQPQLILDVVSRTLVDQGPLSKWFGFQPTRVNLEDVSLEGPNTISGMLRNVTFRYFDATRVPATFRAPGTGPAVIAANPVGQETVACARAHVKIPLDVEQLGNLSPIIGPNSNIDTEGQDYLRRQKTHIARRFNAAVEIMTTGMAQDNLYFQKQGDNWLPLIGDPGSGTRFQVPFRIPSGNKNQLNMLGAGNIIGTSWDNVGANIITDLGSIKAAFAQLSGYPLTDIWINSIFWPNIISNTQVRNVAGSANRPFAEYRWEEERGMDGLPSQDGYRAILAGDPTITWHICDYTLFTNTDVDPSYAQGGGTATKSVPNKMAFMMSGARGEWCKMYHGGEPVVENPGMPMVMRKGYYFWHEWRTQPGGVDLIGLLNAIPILYNQRVIAPASPIFP